MLALGTRLYRNRNRNEGGHNSIQWAFVKWVCKPYLAGLSINKKNLRMITCANKVHNKRRLPAITITSSAET